MNLLSLYRKEREQSAAPIVVASVISGMAQAAVLGIITIAADTAEVKSVHLRFLFLFLGAFAIMIAGKYYAMKQAAVMIEGILKKVRLRVTDKIRHSELLYLERLRKAELYTRLAHNANLISGSSGMIINAVQSVFIVFFCLIFIAMLSRLAFIMVVFAIGFGFSNYIARQAIISEELNVARTYESRFFDMIHQILDGFKELKVNRQKSDAHFSVFMSLAKATKRLKIKTGFRFITGLMYSQTFFYILLALIVFLMPRLEFIDNALIVRITVAVLFLAGPISIITGAYPMYSMANMAATHLYELEEQLDAAATIGHKQLPLPLNPFSPFDHLTFHDVTFSYNNDEGESLFSVGPLDLTVNKGEILFLVGGNGSGKTTLIKLLAGLYYPAEGEIRANSLTVIPTRYQAYRELFAPIFTEFHLFDRLYGLEEIDYPRILELLRLMELESKIDVVDGAFTNLDLSTGQRKRLAMIVALLDDKPIYLLDEWAADQDPHFRKYFYEVLLQDLKARGKTVIAVSHDDRYFHVADRVLKMEYGQFVEAVPKQTASSTKEEET